MRDNASLRLLGGGRLEELSSIDCSESTSRPMASTILTRLLLRGVASTARAGGIGAGATVSDSLFTDVAVEGADGSSGASRPYASMTRKPGDFGRVRAARTVGGVLGRSGSRNNAGCCTAVLVDATGGMRAGKTSEILSAGSEGPIMGTSGMLSPDVFPSTSKRTFRMLLRRAEPPGVSCHAPGGAGVGMAENVLFTVRFAGAGTGVSASGGRRGSDIAGLSSSAFSAGAGVAAHAPGGLGVLAAVKSANRLTRALTGVAPISSSSSEDDGGAGSSGIFRGGDGVSNSNLDVLRSGRRGGVDRPKIGSGGTSRTGERSGEAAVTKVSGYSLASSCSSEDVTACDREDGPGPGSGSLGIGNVVGTAMGVLVTCDSISLSMSVGAKSSMSTSMRSIGSMRERVATGPIDSVNVADVLRWPFFRSPSSSSSARADDEASPLLAGDRIGIRLPRVERRLDGRDSGVDGRLCGESMSASNGGRLARLLGKVHPKRDAGSLVLSSSPVSLGAGECPRPSLVSVLARLSGAWEVDGRSSSLRLVVLLRS